VKRQAQRIGESDLSATRSESVVPSPTAGHPDFPRSRPTKKVATSIAPVDLEYDGHSISGIVDAVLEAGRQRNALLAQLRNALESGQEREALNFARRLCGLPHEESDRTNQSIDRRTSG